MKLRKEDSLIYITIILLVSSLLRKEFLPLFAFSLGFLTGNFNKVEKWITLKEK